MNRPNLISKRSKGLYLGEALLMKDIKGHFRNKSFVSLRARSSVG